MKLKKSGRWLAGGTTEIKRVKLGEEIYDSAKSD
jgi:hypothetical protein